MKEDNFGKEQFLNDETGKKNLKEDKHEQDQFEKGQFRKGKFEKGQFWKGRVRKMTILDRTKGKRKMKWKEA